MPRDKRLDRRTETHPLSPVIFTPYMWQVLFIVGTHLILSAALGIRHSLSSYFKDEKIKLKKLNYILQNHPAGKVRTLKLETKQNKAKTLYFYACGVFCLHVRTVPSEARRVGSSGTGVRVVVSSHMGAGN